jgi:hypothetical protein
MWCATSHCGALRAVPTPENSMAATTAYQQQGTWPAAGAARASGSAAARTLIGTKPRTMFATVPNHRFRRPRGPS